MGRLVSHQRVGNREQPIVGKSVITAARSGNRKIHFLEIYSCIANTYYTGEGVGRDRRKLNTTILRSTKSAN